MVSPLEWTIERILRMLLKHALTPVLDSVSEQKCPHGCGHTVISQSQFEKRHKNQIREVLKATKNSDEFTSYDGMKAAVEPLGVELNGTRVECERCNELVMFEHDGTPVKYSEDNEYVSSNLTP